MNLVDNLTLEEIDRRIAMTAAEAVIAIGYYLKQIRDRKLYEQTGCRDVYEYARKQYGYDRSTTSRNMSRNDRFSVGGNSPELAEQYLGYGKSQLQEMISMTDEQLQQVAPDMTVREMKELKKQPEKTEGPEIVATSQQRQTTELIKPDEDQTRCLNDFAKHFISGHRDWMLGDYHNRVLDVTKSPGEIRKLVGDNGRNRTFMSNGCGYRIHLLDEYVRLQDDAGGCLGNFEWFYLAAAIQRMWHEVTLKEIRERMEDKPDQAETAGPEPVATSQQQEATESNVIDGECRDAESLQEPDLYEETSGRTDKELAEIALDEVQDTLKLMLGTFTEKDVRVRKQKVLIAALAGYIADAENLEIPEPEQPELPVFRNNDQRKEWLRNYKDWGIWYEDANIGATYYKYDFDNGARLIAEVYQHPAEKHCPAYESCFLHLVGGPEPPKKAGWNFGRWTRHESYCKHPSNETELVEFLKEVQRGEK